MLKTSYQAPTDLLTVHFDVPVPEECAGHPEFASLMTRLRQIDGLTSSHHDGRLSAMSLPYAGLIEAFAGQVPDPQLDTHRLIRRELATIASEQGAGLQVNFHQNPFDTDERYWRFILDQGHLDQYFFNRIAWYAAPKNGIVTDFPLHVDIESASTCNMNCPMCYRDQLKRTGQIDFDLFAKAVDECARMSVYSLRLSWRGETLTHPRIAEMIAYATARIPNVSFLTNAFYLTDPVIDSLIESKLAYVAVSFDGIGEVYEAVRRPAIFEESRTKLRRLREKREAAGARLPQVRLCTIWPAVRHDPAAYRTAMEPVSDYMVCNPYINFKGEMKLKKDFICQYPWERIVIGFDGQAQCCTGWEADDIILGNVAEKSISKMWHSPLMNEVRASHKAGRRMDLDSCARCRHGCSGDESANIWDIVGRKY